MMTCKLVLTSLDVLTIRYRHKLELVGVYTNVESITDGTVILLSSRMGMRMGEPGKETVLAVSSNSEKFYKCHLSGGRYTSP